jgi:ankyrin repeat protein
LLAQLHFESISTKRTPKKIKDVLRNLPNGPKGSDYAYEEAMNRIEGQDADSKQLAKQILSWITCSKRPLSTSELQCALAVEVGEAELDEENLHQLEDMVLVCAGLVTVDEESSIIRLVHYTTQEYFERIQHDLFPIAESEIATICVTYLSFNVFKSGYCQTDNEFEKRLQLYKLYDYASHNWGYHARAAFTLISEVNSFLERKTQVEASIQALLAVKYSSSDLNYSQRFPKEMTGLHLAAYFGVKAIIQVLLEKGANINAVDGYEKTPLYLASENGHIEVVQLLLENGANVNAADHFGETPLNQASENGHIEVIQLLLEKGANINAAARYRITPLYRASENGHIGVVQLLLEKGANINEADRFGKTPLYRASENGYTEVVQLLLEKGANVNAANQDGKTPLYGASKNGHVEVVQLLASAREEGRYNGG